MDVSNRGEQLLATRIAKAPTIDITTVGAVAVTASVLRVGTANDHLYSNVDILIQVPLMRIVPEVERLSVALGPLAIQVQPVAWKAGG